MSKGIKVGAGYVYLSPKKMGATLSGSSKVST